MLLLLHLQVDITSHTNNLINNIIDYVCIAIVSEQMSQSVSEEEDLSITLDDIGFAKHSNFQWHPALKTASLAKGSRILVRFFGTGEMGTVNSPKWIKYCAEEEARILDVIGVPSASFVKGLDEMKKLRQKILR